MKHRWKPLNGMCISIRCLLLAKALPATRSKKGNGDENGMYKEFQSLILGLPVFMFAAVVMFVYTVIKIGRGMASFTSGQYFFVSNGQSKKFE